MALVRQPGAPRLARVLCSQRWPRGTEQPGFQACRGLMGSLFPVPCPPSPSTRCSMEGTRPRHELWLEGLAEAPLLEMSGMAGLRLLFPCRHHQPHGHGEVVGQAGQLGDKTEFFHLLGWGKEVETFRLDPERGCSVKGRPGVGGPRCRAKWARVILRISGWGNGGFHFKGAWTGGWVQVLCTAAGPASDSQPSSQGPAPPQRAACSRFGGHCPSAAPSVPSAQPLGSCWWGTPGTPCGLPRSPRPCHSERKQAKVLCQPWPVEPHSP